MLRVAAIDAAAREAGALAQVLLAKLAVTAGPAGLGEPGDADPVTGAKGRDRAAGVDHAPDDFVPGRHRVDGLRQLAVDEMQVGAADAAGAHLDENLVLEERCERRLLTHERPAGRMQPHCQR